VPLSTGSPSFSKRKPHDYARAEIIVTNGSLMLADRAQFRCEIANCHVSEGLVEGSIPGNVPVGRERDRIEALRGGPGGGGSHKRPAMSLPSMFGVHRQLPDVGKGIDQIHTHESHGWFADYEHDRRAVEVIFIAVIREWTDPRRLEEFVRRVLDVSENGEFIRSRRTDGRSRTTTRHG